MKKQLFFWLLIFCAGSLSAQTIKISGYVVDKETQEALIGANVMDTASRTGTGTNSFGYFSLVLPADSVYTIHCSYIGYQPELVTLALHKDTAVTICLKAGSIDLSEVTISAEKRIEERTEAGRLDIPMAVIKTIPNIAGEADVLKAYQLLPGVQAGSEMSNGLYVRGGTPDQNLYLLDDMPLYNVSHLGGFFSTFDPSMVKSIDLYRVDFRHDMAAVYLRL